MTVTKRFTDWLKDVLNISDQIDTEEAAQKIRSNIYFRGPNVWILAFSVIIASVGLNINSTAVIIGAMLISPLMGPIIGLGLALGTNDTALLKGSVRNLLVMVIVSLIAASLYFLISPLNLVNPTELTARTRPTIYDVLIALFGGFAGILESSRKEKGTVLAGVAIATALMPPLCTAGYGIAKANSAFFLGAMLLFMINCVFIILATYILTKYLRFKEAEYASPAVARKTRTLMTLAIIAVMIPSLWSAVLMVMDNNFERNVQAFVSENKNISQGYIYDYKITEGKDRNVEVYFAGKKLTEEEMEFLSESAISHGIPQGRLQIKEMDLGNSDQATDQLLKSIYERAEDEISRKDARIRDLERELSDIKGREVNYRRLAKEIRYSYPEVKDISIARGAEVDDSLRVKDRTVVLATSGKPIEASRLRKVEEWLRLRMEDTTVVVHNIIR
ncbi:MAG: DUF389 domain-containing protein [Bacteroidales bacterium]|nr:DUF389 domain-containing protein [Bacteroidales bacterium]